MCWTVCPAECPVLSCAIPSPWRGVLDSVLDSVSCKDSGAVLRYPFAKTRCACICVYSCVLQMRRHTIMKESIWPARSPGQKVCSKRPLSCVLFGTTFCPGLCAADAKAYNHEGEHLASTQSWTKSLFQAAAIMRALWNNFLSRTVRCRCEGIQS